MEDKLNQLLSDGDYYSAHQLILSLTKRKVKMGKVDDAVAFVKNGVMRLCEAKQYASASDAALSVFEYAGQEKFDEMNAMFCQLLQSPDPQYWKQFLNQMAAREILDASSNKQAVLDTFFASDIAGDSEKLSSTATLAVQLSGSKRLGSFEKYAQVLASGRDDPETLALHMYFVAELSLALVKESQFVDCESFLRSFSVAVNGPTAADSELVSGVEDSTLRLFNFCVLVLYLCQRKSPPKAMLTELLNEYLPEATCRNRPDLNKIRNFVETSLMASFWASAKPRPGAGGPPADLLNMLQGLLGPRK